MPVMKTLGAVVLVVTLTACGGGGSDKADVTKAVRAYSVAFLAGSPSAYSMLSSRCAKTITATQFGAVASLAKTTYGPQTIRSLTVVDTSSTTAHVTYTYDDVKLNQTGQSWVKEAGVWRWDGC